MNLQAIANAAIQPVNPNVPLVVQISTGYGTNDAGTRIPLFAAPVIRSGQVQALSYNEIQHLDGLSIQGVRNAIYINGQLDGLVRPEKKGGDVITMQGGSIWLVAIVLENWPDWCKVAVTRQNPATNPAPSLDYSDPNNSQFQPGLA